MLGMIRNLAIFVTISILNFSFQNAWVYNSSVFINVENLQPNYVIFKILETLNKIYFEVEIINE